MRVAEVRKTARTPGGGYAAGTVERCLTVLESLITAVNRLAELVAVLAFSVMVLNIVVGVFFRYVLNNSLVWTEELARYLFIWVTFLGGGLGVGRNIHIGVDSVTRLLRPAMQRLMEVLVELAIGTFLIALITIGVEYTLFGMHSQALLLPVPMGYIYLAVPVGGVVMLLNVILNVSRHLASLLGGVAGRRGTAGLQ